MVPFRATALIYRSVKSPSMVPDLHSLIIPVGEVLACPARSRELLRWSVVQPRADATRPLRAALSTRLLDRSDLLNPLRPGRAPSGQDEGDGGVGWQQNLMYAIVYVNVSCCRESSLRLLYDCEETTCRVCPSHKVGNTRCSPFGLVRRLGVSSPSVAPGPFSPPRPSSLAPICNLLSRSVNPT